MRNEAQPRVLWLSILTGAFAVWGMVGLVFAFTVAQPWAAGFYRLFWAPFLGSAPLEGPVLSLVSWILGLVAALMTSWSLMGLALVWGPLRRGQPWSWYALTASVALWFVIDESFSLYCGVALNAVGNLGLLLWFLVPLWFLRPGRSPPRGP